MPHDVYLVLEADDGPRFPHRRRRFRYDLHCHFLGVPLAGGLVADCEPSLPQQDARGVGVDAMGDVSMGGLHFLVDDSGDEGEHVCFEGGHGKCYQLQGLPSFAFILEWRLSQGP